MPTVRIGTVDLPERTERSHYFRHLGYLELSALFGGPFKASSLAKWKDSVPQRAVGLVAPWVLTQRKAPTASRLWHHDDTVGDFRNSAHGRSALASFREAVVALAAPHAVFRSPPLFAPSTANRDRLKAFFEEVATPETVGTNRVWVPDGLWEPRAAVKFATELGVTAAIDPLVYDPNTPAEVYEDLEAEALYFRISGLGRSGKIRSEKLDDLAALVEHYEGIELTIAFASPERWNDARNFSKVLDVNASFHSGADGADADDEDDESDGAEDEDSDDESSDDEE